MAQIALALTADDRERDVESIHLGTAIYTAEIEIEALLDRLGWPGADDRLLDPGADNGGFLVAALSRLDMRIDDVREASMRVHGYEFHPGAVDAARRRVGDHLEGRGWSKAAATRAAALVVERKDFLLDEVPIGVWNVVAANPPYWRYANLPGGYRAAFDAAVARHARADLLYAYIQRVAEIVADDGRIGMITADRWLMNAGSSALRASIGARWSMTDVMRLDSASAFYRPKSRSRGTPARVHPVSLILTKDGSGRPLTREPFRIEPVPVVEGTPLSQLATIRLAPWLGPDGIFVVKERGDLPKESLVPCFEPEDMTDGSLAAPSKWAILTDRETPDQTILDHLDAQLDRMPQRGRQKLRWLPPETFHGRLPLAEDAVMVPRISRTLRAIRLPAGTMPINHNLVVVSGIDADALAGMLRDERVRAQADAMALPLESGYRSYTATILRALVVPHDLIRK